MALVFLTTPGIVRSVSGKSEAAAIADGSPSAAAHVAAKDGSTGSSAICR